MGKHWFYHGFTAKFPVDQAYRHQVRHQAYTPAPALPYHAVHHAPYAVPYAVHHGYRGAALPGYPWEDLSYCEWWGGPTTVVKPIFLADLKVDISIQPLLFMEILWIFMEKNTFMGDLDGDLWDLNGTWIDVEACWIIIFFYVEAQCPQLLNFGDCFNI